MKSPQNSEPFQYTYSAAQQAEVERIRRKYQSSDQVEDKMEQLRRLDRSVTQKGTVLALIAGVLGVLILGAGMSAVMVGPATLFFPGIAVGVVGLALTALAYPLYHAVTARQRKKLAPRILALTDELMNR